MARCVNNDGTNACFWADYDPQKERHIVHEAPDYLNQSDPRKAPSMYRELRGCGLGRNEWKQDGPMGHNCPKYVDFEVEKERREADRADHDAEMRANYNGATSRKKIADKTNMFDYITTVVEDSKLAYDWLMDVYMTYGDADGQAVLDFFAQLNDMNIRGRQIDVIINNWFTRFPIQRNRSFKENFDFFHKKLIEEPKTIVAIINADFDKSDEEEAVVSGASKYGHL